MSTQKVRDHVVLTMRKREIEAELRKIKAELELSESELAIYFAQEGVQSIKIDEGTAYLKRELYARLKPDTNGTYEEAHEALRSHGLEYMVKATVNLSTLKAYVREQERKRDDAEPDEKLLPDGLEQYITVTEAFRVLVKQ